MKKKDNIFYFPFFLLLAFSIHYLKDFTKLIIGEDISIYYQIIFIFLYFSWFYLLYFIYDKTIKKIFKSKKITSILNINYKDTFIIYIILSIYAVFLILYKLIMNKDPSSNVSIIILILCFILLIFISKKNKNKC